MENKPNTVFTEIKHDILRKIFSKRFIRFRKYYIAAFALPFGIFAHVVTYPRIVEVR